jgi:hypothetical protein
VKYYDRRFSTIGPHGVWRLFKGVEESSDLLIEIAILLTQLFDLIDRMQNRRVMFVAELSADLGQRRPRELLA